MILNCVDTFWEWALNIASFYTIEAKTTQLYCISTMVYTSHLILYFPQCINSIFPKTLMNNSRPV